jgi:C4-type Zn-finger protein
MKKTKFTMAVFLIALLFSSVLSARQNDSLKINLLNFDDVKSYLNLDFDQQETIEPLIKEIITIKEQNEKAIKEMRSKMQSMGMPDPSIREKMMKERAERQSKIDGLIKQIEKSLNEKQLEKFDEIEKPNLMNKSKQMSKW